MTDCEPRQTSPGLTARLDRRAEARQPASGTLWMIDHDGATVLQCHCLEGSPGGMRLRVPLGYGVAEGQRYELRSHLPGSRPVEGFGLVGRRWATVVRVSLRVVDDGHHLDVGVVLDPMDASPLSFAETTEALV